MKRLSGRTYRHYRKLLLWMWTSLEKHPLHWHFSLWRKSNFSRKHERQSIFFLKRWKQCHNYKHSSTIKEAWNNKRINDINVTVMSELSWYGKTWLSFLATSSWWSSLRRHSSLYGDAVCEIECCGAASLLCRLAKNRKVGREFAMKWRICLRDLGR